MLLSLERLWCGEAQIAARSLSCMGCEPSTCAQLARLRFGSASSTLAEILGYFLFTLGLFPFFSPYWLVPGVILKIGGGLASSVFQNRSGIVLNREIECYLKRLRSYSQEIGALLSNLGVSQIEIRAINSLPSEARQSELNSYSRAALLAIGAPLACGVALILGSAWVMGWCVIGLGLLSLPTGEYYFKRKAVRNEHLLRIARSAHSLSTIQQALTNHLWLTFQVNALSQVPLLLFAIRFLANGFGQLLASFFALTQGLVGLSGALALQQSRTASCRTTQTIDHLLKAISHSSLMVTQDDWNKHIRTHFDDKGVNTPFQNGVILTSFHPILSSSGHDTALPFPPLTCTIESGSSHLIQAPSGTGKSTLLMALVHLLDHKGEIYFVRNGTICNIHTLNRSELDRTIYFKREADIGENLRLTDLFADVLKRELYELYQEMASQFGQVLVELAWQAEESLVLHTPVFPKEMALAISKMQDERNLAVSRWLQEASGNLDHPRMKPDRVFGTLSAGEKRRLMLLLAFREAITQPRDLVILDEPLAHLDEQNIKCQLAMIQRLANLAQPPAQLIVSHQPLHLG